jgi:hypothetical protein
MSASRVALLGGLALALTAVDAVPRQLQAAGKPDKCTDDASFQAWLAVANQACCTKTEATCTNGLPSDCDSECANIMIPMKKNCKTQLQNGGLWDTVNTVSSKCPKLPKGQHKGCPKNIPSVSDMNAEQACGSGDGFWPTGSTCAVSCAAPGGGHRRVQAGASVDYVCTQGGNWVSTGPIDCRVAPPVAGFGQDTGRFTVAPQPMSASAAAQYCRQQGGSLASIHSYEEQLQANSACSAVTADATATGGGYGCWIGFEDSAAQGGFIWTDGSNVDFVNWAPGEPNGGNNVGQSAVSIDLRGHQGSFDSQAAGNGMMRNGEWNDDGRADGVLLPAICQSSIPTGSPAGQHVWGTGSTTSFNLRVCVDADDYLFFQDDRMWLQYGGNWGAAGQHGACPEDYQGKAYINDAVGRIGHRRHAHDARLHVDRNVSSFKFMSGAP